MKNPRMKKPISTLAERLKAIRRRPLTDDQVKDLNRIFDEMEKNKKSGQDVNNSGRKSARGAEVEM